MNWKNFEETPNNFPEKIAKEVICGFSCATEELLELETNHISRMKAWRFHGNMADDFNFEISLKSPYVIGYYFRVLLFSYDAQLNLVKCKIDDKIKNELGIISSDGIEYSDGIYLCRTKWFADFLELIFKTKQFENVVSGLMKIAKKKLIEKVKINSK